MPHKKKSPSQASGQAAGPSKLQKQSAAKGNKYPWETAENAAKRLAKKLNPFD